MMDAVLWLGCTIAVYWAAKRLYKKYPKMYMSPLLLTPVVLIGLLAISGASFQTYNEGGVWLSNMVEPATIALAVTMYKHIDLLKKHAFVIVVSVGCGALTGIVTSAGLARLFGLTSELIGSLTPRSATTPIAVSITGLIGGIPTIAAVATLITGLLGLVIGPPIVKWCGIRSSIAQGILFGTSAHSAGISRASEYGTAAGSIAGVAMLLTAFVTLGAAPWMIEWFR
ncbi:LrgB family protein [Paenibacillus sp. GYB004]|uniref:LrgB family protein n=1 Tax=Paenibacillus sp. GYB004 TaxID=2994393 RepID=UPI002F9616C2